MPKGTPRLHSLDEGLASYRISLTEIVAVARSINATLVEPCFSKSTVRGCNGKAAKVRFDDVFDLQRLRRFLPVVSEQELQADLARKKNKGRSGTLGCACTTGSPPQPKFAVTQTFTKVQSW